MTEKKQISVSEYAAIVGKSRQWVVFCLLHDKILPLIKSYEKIGRAYIITLE